MTSTFNTEAYMAHLQNRLDRITVDSTHLTIKGNEDYLYEISLDRINTAPKILQWVIHLSEKSWMSTDLIRQFVYAACNKAGIDPENLPA